MTVQLSDVRLAKAFYAQESCVAAIQNRLRELVAILYGILILLKKFSLPTFKLNRNSHWNFSSASVSATAAAHSGGSMHCISTVADSPQVPDAVPSLAIEVLTWLKE